MHECATVLLNRYFSGWLASDLSSHLTNLLSWYLCIFHMVEKMKGIYKACAFQMKELIGVSCSPFCFRLRYTILQPGERSQENCGGIGAAVWWATEIKPGNTYLQNSWSVQWLVVVVYSQSCVQLLLPRDLQAPLSMGFPRQKYWGRLPFFSLGDLPNPGIKPTSPALQALSPLQADSLPLSH